MRLASRMWGAANAKLICRALNQDPQRILNATVEKLSEISGVGGVIAGTFVEYFADEGHRNVFLKLLDEVRIPKEESRTAEQIFSGMNFVITGKRESLCQPE